MPESQPSCSNTIVDSRNTNKQRKRGIEENPVSASEDVDEQRSSSHQEQPNSPPPDVVLDVEELLKKSAREQFELLRIKEERLRMQEERLKTLEQMAMLRELAGGRDQYKSKQVVPTIDLETIRDKELPKAKPVRYDVSNPMMGSYQKRSK